MKPLKISFFYLLMSFIFISWCSFTTNTKENETNDINNSSKEAIEKAQNTIEENFVEYENKKHNFKIEIPSTRSFQEDNLWFDIKLNTPKNNDINENLWIKVQELKIKHDEESYIKTTINELKKLYADLIEEEIKDTYTNNWKSIIYEFSDKWLNLKAQQTVFIINNKAYVFTYTATKDTFDNYINEINNIINSLTILN